jgi:hypothetical protein
MKLRVLLLSFLVSFATLDKASAALIFDFREVSGNVEMTMSGSIDLDATLGLMSFAGNTLRVINPNRGNILAGDAVHSNAYDTSARDWTPFGSGSLAYFNTSAGDRVSLFFFGDLGLPIGYASDAPLSATGTLLGASFASLGMAPGSYVTSFRNGSVVDSVTVDVMPEPATLLLLGVGLVGSAVRRFRKRKYSY